MELDQLRTLLEEGETLTTEFKRGKHGLSDDKIAEAVICLANGEGGTLILGAEDDGAVTGLQPRHGDVTEPHRLQAMILNKTDPPVATDVSVVSVDSVEVAVVSVAKAASPVGTKSGKYVRRTLRADGHPECVPYPLHEMMSVGLVAQGRDYAATPARGAQLSDLDPEEFRRFRRLCASAGGDTALSEAQDLDVLRALRLVLPGQQNELTLGAILLFGKQEAIERYVPSAEVVFNELRGDAVSASDIFHGPLFKAAQRLYDLIDVRNTEEEVMVGLHRVAVPRIPVGTVRESIANALVHRDYSENASVQVQWSDGQFRVSSPGGFPSGISLSNLLSDSRPRSPILAEAFRRAGIADRVGRGVSLMYKQLLRTGRGEPDYSLTNDKTVILTIATCDADLEMVQFVTEYETTSQVPLTLIQLRILHEVRATGPQTAAELAEALRETSETMRSQLSRLIELGILEVRGRGRGRQYHLAAAFYRLAQSSHYVRLQDTDPLQQEQMVLAYVDTYKTITRGKAAELCRLTPQQASTLLKKLVGDGELELRGQRRGAHYVRAGSD